MTEIQHKLCQFLRKTTNHSFPKYKRVVLVSASEHGINEVLPSAHKLQDRLKLNITSFLTCHYSYLPARPFLCLALALLTHSAAIVLMLFWVSK